MSRYFFHVCDDEVYVDLQGTELQDLCSARREAARYVGGLLADKPDEFWSQGEWTLRVADADDLTQFQLTIFVTEAPVGSKA